MRVVFLVCPREESALGRAERWAAWIERTHPVAVNTSWLLVPDPDRTIEHVRRSDEIWAVGGVITEDMKAAINAAAEQGVPFCDLTEVGEEPPLPSMAVVIPPLRWLARKRGQRVRRRTKTRRCRRT